MTITPEQMIAWLNNEALSGFGPLSSNQHVREKEDHDAKIINAILSHIRRTTDPKWKLVPVEPTEEMESRFFSFVPDSATHLKPNQWRSHDFYHKYRAMLAAAPTQED